LKPGFIREEHTYDMPAAIEGEHLPTEVGYDTELQSSQNPGENGKQTDEIP
jgi:hypothetical protein